MTIYEWILFFIIAICFIITGISVFKWWDWSREANENLDLYLREKNALDIIKAELDEKNKELETIREIGRVVKIERFYSQPKEIECRFLTPQMFVEDTETFKKIVISETARYIAEEIEKDPYLCKVFHSVNAFDCRENISVRMRMLPYAEGVVWDDIFKEDVYEEYDRAIKSGDRRAIAHFKNKHGYTMTKEEIDLANEDKVKEEEKCQY